jgi:hypothetical protein
MSTFFEGNSSPWSEHRLGYPTNASLYDKVKENFFCIHLFIFEKNQKKVDKIIGIYETEHTK